MIELSEQNVAEYLRGAGRASEKELLVQSLSGGVANVVLKVFDTGGGEKVGTDLRSAAQKQRGKPDERPNRGCCFVLKQPLGKFKTAAEWIVDIDRVKVERDSMGLLGGLLPAGSVPEVLWFDEANYILAISCAPVGSVIWKKALLEGQAMMEAATQAGMLLAMMHSSTREDAAVAKRYGDPKFFIQQRINPYLHATAEKHPGEAAALQRIAEELLATQHCLIHGDFSPKNIFLVPREQDDSASAGANSPQPAVGKMELSHLLLLDFEVAFYGHAVFDVATLINHCLLKGFYHHKKWRGFMMLADNFWQTYRHTADPELVRAVDGMGGHMLGALLLARIDGKSPAEYLIGHPEVQEQVRKAAKDILSQRESGLEQALDTVSGHFDVPD